MHMRSHTPQLLAELTVIHMDHMPLPTAGMDPPGISDRPSTVAHSLLHVTVCYGECGLMCRSRHRMAL